jgi:hypothetical protein
MASADANSATNMISSGTAMSRPRAIGATHDGICEPGRHPGVPSAVLAAAVTRRMPTQVQPRTTVPRTVMASALCLVTLAPAMAAIDAPRSVAAVTESRKRSVGSLRNPIIPATTRAAGGIHQSSGSSLSARPAR